MTWREIFEAACAELEFSGVSAIMPEYETKFARYANDALRQIAKRADMYRTEPIELINGCFAMDDLSRECRDVQTVTQNGRALRFLGGDSYGEIRVDGCGTVDVRYRYYPKRIHVGSTAELDIPQPFRPCIAEYIIARYRSGMDAVTQSGASVHYQLYNDMVDDVVKRMYGSPDSFKFKNRDVRL